MNEIRALLDALEPRRDISRPAPETKGLVRTLFPRLGASLQRLGRPGAAEILRIAAKSPFVLVGCLGFVPRPANAEGQSVATLTLAAWIVTRDVDPRPADPKDPKANYPLARDDRAQFIALALAQALRDWDPGQIPGVTAGEAEEVRADAIWSVKEDDKGIALWGVSWKQDVVLEARDPSAPGPVPSELYVEWGGDGAERLIPAPREAVA